MGTAVEGVTDCVDSIAEARLTSESSRENIDDMKSLLILLLLSLPLIPVPSLVVVAVEELLFVSKVGSIAKLINESSRLSIPPTKLLVEDIRRVSAEGA